MILLLPYTDINGWRANLPGLSGKWSPVFSRIISLVTIIIDLAVIMVIFCQQGTYGEKQWMVEFTANWIPGFGVGMHLALDGLSLLLLILTFFIGIIAVLISWKEITENTGFFPFQYIVDISRHYRSISFRRSLPVLFFLGGDADTDVFSHWYLGSRKPYLCLL